MEFAVDSRFNGRPIPQISSLIINQIKRTINKKHVLPSYKMRYRPLFIKPEESFINPDLCFHGNKLGPGKLSVKVLKCSRLLELAPDSKLFVTLSVDKEEIEEVWRQSWTTLNLNLQMFAHPSGSGLTLKDQLSGDKTERKRVIVENIAPQSPACAAGLQRGDIIETIGDVRVLSFKHASKQLKNAGESVMLRIRRQSRLAYGPDQLYGGRHPADFEVEEFDMEDEADKELTDYVNIDLRSSRTMSVNTSVSNNSDSPKPTRAVPADIPVTSDSDSLRFREKLTRKIQSGKKKLLGVRNGDKDAENNTETKSLPAEDELSKSLDRNVTPVAASNIHDRSQSAKSSPQKQVLDLNKHRAHSDTSLSKAAEADTSSVASDVGSFGCMLPPKRIGEVSTREILFTSEPEWNEEFEFDCKEEDRYVNICVWCKMAHREKPTKNMPATSKTDLQQKSTPPAEDFPAYNITTKIGYVSIPLSDVAAGCMLTLQGDTQYTMYLQPPEETVTVSRTKLPYSGHLGFDSSRCHGDITLSFVHKPFKVVDAPVRKEIVRDILDPPTVKLRTRSLERVRSEDEHVFRACQFTSKTMCDLCGKKIWLKGGYKCCICDIVCHKKCVEKCHVQTKCSKDGPKMASNPKEPWVRPRSNEGGDKEDGKGKFWKGFRRPDTSSLPLNIPTRTMAGKPSRSPAQSPGSLPHMTEGQLGVTEMKKNLSNKSLQDEDWEEDFGYKEHAYSLDDNVVIEAKEKGKQLYADLTLPERKRTLDEMVTKLQNTIDKESEYKAELMKQYRDTTDMEQKRIISQQLEKCDEKIEALMMMLVHYCAGLQHCLDQEEAHRRLQGIETGEEPVTDESADAGETVDTGIQFVITDT